MEWILRKVLVAVQVLPKVWWDNMTLTAFLKGKVFHNMRSAIMKVATITI